MILFKIKETAHFNSGHVLFLRFGVAHGGLDARKCTWHIKLKPCVLFVGHENSDPDQNSAAYEQGRHDQLHESAKTSMCTQHCFWLLKSQYDRCRTNVETLIWAETGGWGRGWQGPRTSPWKITSCHLFPSRNWYELPSRSNPPLELSGSAHTCLTVEFYFSSSFFACKPV